MKLFKFLLPITFLIGCNNVQANTSNNINVSISENITNTTSINENISTSTNDKFEISTPNKDETITSDLTNPKKKLRVYINPSVQTNNLYYNRTISEAIAMNKVGSLIYTKLKNDDRFIVYMNDKMLPLKESVKEINSLNIDYQIALHTNAGGGTGTESFYHGDKSFANTVLKNVVSKHSFKNRGVKDGSWIYELKNSKAKNKCLIEFLFHDNETEATWILAHYTDLASSIVESLIDVYNK